MAVGDEDATLSGGLLACSKTHPDYPYCPPPEKDPCASATASLSASPPNILQGQSSTLFWSFNIPPGCVGALTLSSKPVAVQGAMSVTPLADQPYQLRLGTRTLATVTVKVTLPKVVRIKGNTAEWRRLLIQALGTAGTRVVLEPNVDMDMTGFENIYIVQGVTLTSEAPSPGIFQNAMKGPAFLPGGVMPEAPPARSAHALGPRLYTTSRPRPLFNIRCNGVDLFGDNVRLSGFRLQGPHWDTEEGDDNLERGVMVDSCVGVEISNMELSGWSGQAIYVRDVLDRQFNPDAVKVHDNFIHHNQHEGGNGYGIVVSAGGYASIERNVFDFNRHAIAASGKPGVGYRANHNLVLRGGGVHGKWYNEFTHQFDVHGDENCPDIPGNQHTWNCGMAGDQFWFTNNAFQYVADDAIKLRGVPRVAANIWGNVFAHGSVSDAVETKSGVNVYIGPNTANVDTFGEYGVCDFDGDGKDDLFLATGASWWYSSAGKLHWTWLSANTERLDQVGLGDFDGDGRCDVFAHNPTANQWELSKGGKGAWAALPATSALPVSQLRFGDFNGDGITDVFHRSPSGQWYAISPGNYGWTALQSSSFALKDLKLGDFNGDGVTDILSRAGGKWSISFSATSAWQPWNPSLSDELAPLLVANLDGIPGDDVLRYVATSVTSGRWDISSGGKGNWQPFASRTWSASSAFPAPAVTVRTYVGRFDPWANADVLAVDFTRTGALFSKGQTGFVAHSRYAY